MKQLMLCIMVLVVSCSKPVVNPQNKTIFYRIEQIDADGITVYSEIQTIKTKLESCEGDGDEDEDDDHHPLSVKFVFFSVTLNKSNKPLLKWQVDNEMPTNTYNIQRSIDAKSWQNIAIVVASGAPIYSYIDNQ